MVATTRACLSAGRRRKRRKGLGVPQLKGEGKDTSNEGALQHPPHTHDKPRQTTGNFPLAHGHWEPLEPRPASKCSGVGEERETDGGDDAWSFTCVAGKMPVIAHPDVEAKQGTNRRHPRPRPRDKVMKPRPVQGEGRREGGGEARP